MKRFKTVWPSPNSSPNTAATMHGRISERPSAAGRHGASPESVRPLEAKPAETHSPLTASSLATVVVTTTDDVVDANDQVLSLREAIPRHFYYRDDGVAGQVSATNIAVTTTNDPGEIPDADPDHLHTWFSIQVASALPAIAPGTPILLDGYTQPGASENTNPVGQELNAILKIELTGASGNGLSINNLGTLKKSSGTGTSTIDMPLINSGNYTQLAGGTLLIEIGGLAAGTEFDQLAGTGSAALAGTLAVELIARTLSNQGDMLWTGGEVFRGLDNPTFTNTFATAC